MSKSPRINVTFEADAAGALAEIAKRENKSLSSLVRDLTIEGLSQREDMYLSDLAEKLDVEGAKTYRHDDVWK